MAADDVAAAVAGSRSARRSTARSRSAGPSSSASTSSSGRPCAPDDDPREVVADPHARYFGTELGERSLVPGDDAELGPTRFEDWLGQQSQGR